MFSPRIPNAVSFELVSEADFDSRALFPEEHSLVASSSEKRIKEFTLGRIAARRSVLQLGVRSDTPILRGEKGQPLWPAPVVGAISHAGGYAAAASTIASDISAIGLDMEQSHREVPLSFAKRICVPEEAVWALAEPADTSRRLVRLFSAKEAFYKAVFPLLGTLIRFKDVKLVWNEDRQLFEGTLLLHLSDDFPADYSFEITLEQTHDFLLSVVVIKR